MQVRTKLLQCFFIGSCLGLVHCEESELSAQSELETEEADGE